MIYFKELNMPLTVLITGANRGIGLALAEQYITQGAEVIAVCRQKSDSLLALGAEIIENIDVTSSSAMKLLTNKLASRRVDVLINNAGILRDESLDNLNYEQIIEQFEVNTLGPIRVVEAVLNNLKQGSKIALITSRMGSIEDNDSGGRYGYRISKCGLNAAGKSMAVDLKEKGVSVAVLHPGFVQTEMVNFGGLISAEQSAISLVKRIEELNIANTGTFWHSNGEVLPW
jgi:NAD(P)-dependent dehydrogenase (short-subunit alcohol dehydrogenase family)